MSGAVRPFMVTPCERDGTGDYSTNFALCNQAPGGAQEMAVRLASALSAYGGFEKIEAVAGYVNMTMTTDFIARGAGKTISCEIPTTNKPISYNIEYVSVNPNGPVTVASGRGAVIGDVLSRVLSAVGHDVTREYYVNDGASSEQMRLFASSVVREITALDGVELDVADQDHEYKGDYIAKIALELKEMGFTHEAPLEDIRKQSLEIMLKTQEQDLRNFGCEFDVWFRESDLIESGANEAVLDDLRNNGYSEVQDDAVYATTERLGDTENRVIVRSDGRTTYYLSDIAYLKDKLSRGFEQLIILVGPDHHGYIARLKAAMAMLGHRPERLDVALFQVVNFTDSNGNKVVMRKRDGNIYSLADLVAEAGVDNSRWFYLSRSSNKAIHFNVDLAKSTSVKNPVYYVKYACARAHGAFNKALTAGVMSGKAELGLCNDPTERALMIALDDWKSVITDIAESGHDRVHLLCEVAYDMAKKFHLWYDTCRIVSEDRELSLARGTLAIIFWKNMKVLLGLMGIEAPTAMERKGVEVAGVPG